MQDIADEFKVPRYCLSSSPTHFISLLFALREWNVQGRIPAKKIVGGKPYTIPGMPPIAPLELPRNLQGDIKNAEFFLYQGECLWRAAGVLVNSVYELESSIIEGLQDYILLQEVHSNNNNNNNKCKTGRNQVLNRNSNSPVNLVDELLVDQDPLREESFSYSNQCPNILAFPAPIAPLDDFF